MRTTTRRSRMQRTRTGKRLEITPRDVELFRLLERYRYLPSTFLHAFLGSSSEKRLKERLGDLYHEGYIDRPGQQWQRSGCLHSPAIYEADAGGRRVLHELGMDAELPVTPAGRTAHRQFDHALQICETMASIELELRGYSNLRFIGWPEIRARLPEGAGRKPNPLEIPVLLPLGTAARYERANVSIIPDALFGIAATSGTETAYRFFALELDRGTMPVERADVGQSSFLRKIVGYGEIIARRQFRTQLGLPNLIVLTLTAGERRRDSLMAACARASAFPEVFLFRAITEFGDYCSARMPMEGIVSLPWQRGDAAQFAITETGPPSE